MKKLVIFDLDNTLLNGDSDRNWGEFLAEKRIVNDDYDYNDEPNSYVNDLGSKIFLFQEQSTAPVIDIEPMSSIACYVGSPAEFEVTAQSNQKINYSWQLSTDNGISWSNLLSQTD